jgi:hypothetical protein
MFWNSFLIKFNGDFHFMIGVTIYGNTNKHISATYILEQFFGVNSMVMWVLWSEWQSDYIWQYQQTNRCYICAEVVFWCETGITIEFASKNYFRTYITLMCLPITKWTSPLNPHQKTAPEHICIMQYTPGTK